jgi:hypothetical protein
MSVDTPRLRLLGDALIEAAAADLARRGSTRGGKAAAGTRSGRDDGEAGAAHFSRGRRRLSTRARVALGLVALALALPAAAIATGVLSTSEEVADGLPNGAALLVGTDPHCAPLREGIEYECVLSSPPKEMSLRDGYERAFGEWLGEPGEWMGVVEVTVDPDKHVNGGCRSRNADGTLWRCYLGEEAVRHKIIGRHFLGDYLPEPLQE